ncbi:MAG: hemolysin III family protein [Actinomycetota bacterium]|nr:hemolysin III family protein [Actinomycetota bacterium]
MQRHTLGKMQNPVRGFLHGGAALAAVVGLVLLILRAWGSAAAITGVLIFGVATLMMFTVSSLYHSIPWGETWKARFQRLDHSMIYLVVAGTFTPIAIAALDGISLVAALGLVWVIALVGIVLKAFLPNVRTWLSIALQMLMGWTAIVWTPRILDELGMGAIILVLAGGAAYTIGTVIFMAKWPRLAPRSFSYHELFHVLVITGAVLHFLAIFIYAIPATV